MTSQPANTLRSPAVQQTLQRLHAEAQAEQGGRRWPGLGIGRRLRSLRPPPSMQTIAEQGQSAYLCVSPVQGQLLYLLLRLSRAQQVVEFGTSFGVSAIYLAAAVRDNGGGRVICTELLPDKAARAQQNIQAAGLADVVEVRVGDAQQTLRSLPDRVDALFLDGHKPLYPAIFSMIEPNLVRGGLVVADNVLNFSGMLRPYTRMVRQHPDLWTLTVPLGGGMAISLVSSH